MEKSNICGFFFIINYPHIQFLSYGDVNPNLANYTLFPRKEHSHEVITTVNKGIISLTPELLEAVIKNGRNVHSEMMLIAVADVRAYLQEQKAQQQQQKCQIEGGGGGETSGTSGSGRAGGGGVALNVKVPTTSKSGAAGSSRAICDGVGGGDGSQSVGGGISTTKTLLKQTAKMALVVDKKNEALPMAEFTMRSGEVCVYGLLTFKSMSRFLSFLVRV